MTSEEQIEAIGERIREEMAWQSIRPAGLARATGIEVRRLRRKLANPGRLTVDELDVIAKVLGLRVSQLAP